MSSISNATAPAPAFLAYFGTSCRSSPPAPSEKLCDGSVAGVWYTCHGELPSHKFVDQSAGRMPRRKRHFGWYSQRVATCVTQWVVLRAASMSSFPVCSWFARHVWYLCAASSLGHPHLRHFLLWSNLSPVVPPPPTILARSDAEFAVFDKETSDFDIWVEAWCWADAFAVYVLLG